MCACGCGDLAAPGRRYINGHNAKGRVLPPAARRRIAEAMTGERNHRFGSPPANFIGRTTTREGYVLVHLPEHPFAVRGNVMEHRVVLETHLREVEPSSPFLREVDGKRYLDRWVDVHHVNGVKDDNRPENLVAMSKRDHAKLHAHGEAPGATT